MTRYHDVKCKRCGYFSRVCDGTPEPDQTLADLNEDFSKYVVMQCNHCKTITSYDMYDRQFDEKCSTCRNVLVEVKTYPPKICPKCNGELMATEARKKSLVEKEKE